MRKPGWLPRFWARSLEAQPQILGDVIPRLIKDQDITMKEAMQDLLHKALVEIAAGDARALVINLVIGSKPVTVSVFRPEDRHRVADMLQDSANYYRDLDPEKVPPADQPELSPKASDPVMAALCQLLGGQE